MGAVTESPVLPGASVPVMGDEELLRAARIAAYVAAGGFLVQTVLFLLAATGVLGRPPELVNSTAPRELDYAKYYADFFNYQHRIVWSVALRDAIGPVVWVAVGILAVLTAVLLRSMRARVAALVICLGASLVALADLVFGTLVGFWRYGGWDAAVPSDMIAAGRSYQGVKTISTYLQYDGFIVLAAGLLVLAAVTDWTRVFRRLLRLTAVLLVAYVVLDWIWPLWHGSQMLRDILALALGVVLAPVLVIVWHRELRPRTDG